MSITYKEQQKQHLQQKRHEKHSDEMPMDKKKEKKSFTVKSMLSTIYKYGEGFLIFM